MTYSLTVYQGDGVTIPFKSKYNLTGFTFVAQFSSTSDFASVTTAGSISYISGQFLLTLTSGEMNTLGSKYFRVRATKAPDTYYLIAGYINYLPNTASTIGSSDVDSNGYLKGESIFYTVGGGGGSAPDATSTVKGIVLLAGDLAGTASSPTVPGLASKANIASPTFTGTVSGISKSMVGLGNVDNTADTAKPVSTAQQTALNLKANLASPTFTGTVSGITPAMVGLGNVSNIANPTAYVRVALWDGTNYLCNGVAVTSSNRVSGTYYRFIGGPDPSGLSLGIINGDEWKSA